MHSEIALNCKEGEENRWMRAPIFP